jgi:hypothetical protein
MVLPDRKPEDLTTAMDRFDRELRNTTYANWQQDRSFKYALERQGRLYPVKIIVSLATDVPVSQFGGGAESEANRYVRKRGFTPINLRENSIKQGLERILSEYKSGRTTAPFGKNHPLWSTFENVRRSLADSNAVKQYVTLTVSWSAGEGQWASVPWIAILDSRGANEIQKGIYCVFLFRQDMTGVYLTLNQGVRKLLKELGRQEARASLRSKAEEIREKVSRLTNYGFSLDDKIDLRAASGLGSEYTDSTIGYKLYTSGQVPDDEIIEEDLAHLLGAYVDYLSGHTYEGTNNSAITQVNMQGPLNLILYGPPGTGKTYQTIRKAVLICDGSLPSSDQAIQDRYKELREENRIEFVTFHQSYGYEDFVEGIRPVLSASSENDGLARNQVRYECRDGVFKRICSFAVSSGIRAGHSTAIDLTKQPIWKMSLGNTANPDDAEVYDQCLENNQLRLGYGLGLDFSGCDERRAVAAKHKEADQSIKDGDFSIDAVNRFKNEMQAGDLVVISDGNLAFRAIGRVVGSYAPLPEALHIDRCVP